MRVLIINDRRIGGGAEVQTQRELDMLRERGHDARLLNFDPDYPFEATGYMLNVPVRRNNVQKAIFRVFRSPEEKVIKKLLDDVNPEVVHLQNVYDASASLFKIVAGYPTLQTVRDYTIVCPKSTCITNDCLPCEGFKLGKCLKCCKGNVGFTVRTLIQNSYNRNRMRAVNMLVAPSRALSLTATMNGLPVEELSNPFDFAKVNENKCVMSGKKRYLAYGRIGRVKGFTPLIEAWSYFASNRDDVELVFAGQVDDDYEAEFTSLCAVATNVNYLGLLKYNEIMALYPSIYCVVVPSLWMENYPNTVLEALANKTLVIGSLRGGIPEMVGDDRFLFEPTQEKEIARVLETTISLTDSEYQKITDSNYERVLRNNSINLFYNRLLTIFEGLAASTSLKG